MLTQANEPTMKDDYFDAAPVAYFVVNPTGVIQKANKQALEFTGYSLEELKRMNVIDLYGEEFKTEAIKLFKKFKSGIPIKNEETMFVKKDGTKLWALLSVTPVKDESGIVIGSRSMLVDISKQKSTEMELLKKSEELKKLNSILVGREVKMSELKEEIKLLREKLKQL